MQGEIKHPEICPMCKRKMSLFYKKSDEDNNLRTHNSCFLCENKECVLSIDAKKIKTWEKI